MSRRFNHPKTARGYREGVYSERGFTQKELADQRRQDKEWQRGRMLEEGRALREQMEIEEDFILSYADLFFFKGWFVYAWRRDKEYLYIGSTVNVLSRLNGHHVINVIEPFRKTDELVVTTCSSKDTMRFAEQMLIQKYQPKHNTVGK